MDEPKVEITVDKENEVYHTKLENFKATTSINTDAFLCQVCDNVLISEF